MAEVFVRTASELVSDAKLAQPVPLMVRYSAVLWPFRSRIAPEVTVVPSVAMAVVAPSAPTPPSLTTPELMASGPRRVAELLVLRKSVLVPDLVRVKAEPALMTPSVRSP